MGTLEDAVALLGRFVAGERLAWDQLARQGVLRRGLAEAVERADPTDLSHLAQCRRLLADPRAAGQVEAFCRMEHYGSDVDAERLHRNARRLVATAEAAIALSAQRQTREAAQLAGDGAGGRQFAEARLWTLYWLPDFRSAFRPAVRLNVLGQKQGAAADGFLAELGLSLLDDPPPAQLVEHPEGALRPIVKGLLDALNKAWQPLGRSAWWSLTGGGGPLPPGLPLDGDSLGAAATVGFRMLGECDIADPGCAISARVGDDGHLRGVNGLVGPSGEPGPKLIAARDRGLRRVIVAPEDLGALNGTAREALGRDGLEVTAADTVERAGALASGLLDPVRRHFASARELARDQMPVCGGARARGWDEPQCFFYGPGWRERRRPVEEGGALAPDKTGLHLPTRLRLEDGGRNSLQLSHSSVTGYFLSDWVKFVGAGAVLLVLGPQGCGKTTCLWRSFFDGHPAAGGGLIPLWVDTADGEGDRPAPDDDDFWLFQVHRALAGRDLRPRQWKEVVHDRLRGGRAFFFLVRADWPPDARGPRLRALGHFHEDWRDHGHRWVVALDGDGPSDAAPSPGPSPVTLRPVPPSFDSVRAWVWQVRRTVMQFAGPFPRERERAERWLAGQVGANPENPWPAAVRLASAEELREITPESR